jgi:hypothetical protein
MNERAKRTRDRYTVRESMRGGGECTTRWGISRIILGCDPNCGEPQGVFKKK